MKILVAAKRVVDPSMRIRVKPDGSGVDIADLRMSINPFDEIALEQAIQMKEAGQGRSDSGREHRSAVRARHAADGTGNGRRPRHPDPDRHGRGAPRCRQNPAARCTRRTYRADLMGKQAIDDDCNQTGQMLAALLDWPQGTFASAVVLGGNALTVTREIDTGLQTIRMPLPAVVTTDLRLNQPRYPLAGQYHAGAPQADRGACNRRSRHRRRAAPQADVDSCSGCAKGRRSPVGRRRAARPAAKRNARHLTPARKHIHGSPPRGRPRQPIPRRQQRPRPDCRTANGRHCRRAGRR